MHVWLCDAGEAEMKLQLRALDETLAESRRLNRLTEMAATDPGGYFYTFTLCLYARMPDMSHAGLATKLTRPCIDCLP